jgi:hypothetical protein
VDAVKLHEMRLHVLNGLVGNSPNKDSTQLGDARSEGSLESAALTVGAIPSPPSFFIPGQLPVHRCDMHNKLVAKYGLGLLMHTRLMKAAVHC